MVPERNSEQRGRSVKQKISMLFILAAAGLWGSTGIFIRALTGYGMTSMQVMAGKAVFGLITVTLFLLTKDRSLFRIQIRDLGWFSLNGIISVFFYTVCYIKTIQLSGMATAAILLYTSPIFVVFLSILVFKEKLTIIKCVSLGLAFIGCILVSGMGSGRSSISSISLVLGLCSGFGYALYSIFTRILVKRYHSLTIALYTALFTALAAVCAIDVPGIFAVYKEFPQAAAVHMLVGICTNAVPSILYTYALMHIEASRASMLASVELVVAALLGFLVLHESLSVAAITGIGCMIMMVILLSKCEN